MYRYAVAGLHIESQTPLPGLAGSASSDAAPDLAIRLGDAPETLDQPLETGPNWQRSADAFLLTIPGVARFLIREGREILAEPGPGTPPEDIAVFLAGPLVGVCLHLRGRTPLLASAVSVDGKAVLFCGESGAGKSTVAAALAQRGYRLICDDLCEIDLAAPGGPAAVSDAASLKLWANTLRRLELAPGPPVRASLQKHHFEPPAGRVAAAPIRAIYILQEPRAPARPGLEHPNVTDRAILVRRAAYRPNLVRGLAQRDTYFLAAARLAGAASVVLWRRPLGFDRMEAQLDELEAHWAKIGVRAAA